MVAGVVVPGCVMSVLDTIVVSVALATFMRTFHASYATVAWSKTAYTLALATVIRPASLSPCCDQLDCIVFDGNAAQ